jgi:MOSC domain-containing protein YiiM
MRWVATAVDIGRLHDERGRIGQRRVASGRCVAAQDGPDGDLEEACAGTDFAGRLNLSGDGQGDLGGHGGEQRAIMVYQLESYRYWWPCRKTMAVEAGPA